MSNSTLRFVAVLFVTVLAGIGAKAQTSGTTTLNVKLNDALSITVNDPTVLLQFVTTADYQNGVSVTMPSHLTVSSNQAYTLNVKTAAATLAGTGANVATLNASIVSVQLDNPVAQALGGTANTVNSLSSTNQPILSSATAVINKNVNIKYAIPSSVSSTSQVLGKPADTYSTTVTYTISNN
ncbi:MAG: hypothetical protein J0I41_20885 [Filimonas sp.]|nr:hypothetical protein [Filimonas sp.]